MDNILKTQMSDWGDILPFINYPDIKLVNIIPSHTPPVYNILYEQLKPPTVGVRDMSSETKDASLKRFDDTVFFIEATSNEQFEFWSQFKTRVNWEEDSSGMYLHVGCINDDRDMPVYVNFSFAKWYGQRVCFYEPTSRYVDNMMVRDFIEKNYPRKYDNGTRWAITNASNIHYALHECERLSEEGI